MMAAKCDCPQNYTGDLCQFACNATSCCEDGPNPLCCQNGVCSNPNFTFTGNNADQCQCLCPDNWGGKVTKSLKFTLVKIKVKNAQKIYVRILNVVREFVVVVETVFAMMVT